MRFETYKRDQYPPSEFMSIDELCHAARVGCTKAYKIINAGELTAHKQGRRIQTCTSLRRRWVRRRPKYQPRQKEE